MIRHIFFFFSRFVPREYRFHFEKMFLYAGVRSQPRYWLGLAVVSSFLAFFLCLLLLFLLLDSFRLWFFGLGFFAFFLVHFLVYVVFYFRIMRRKEHVERVLPDFLQLMAANVRAGMTPYHALRLSLRDEFGPLREELLYATNRALGTENFSQVLSHAHERVPSELFQRALELLTSSLRGGGKLSLLLDDLAEEVIEMRTLRKELVLSTRTYALFILFAVLVGAPLLFAISSHFLTVLTSLEVSTRVVGESALLGQIHISVEFFLFAASLFLILTSVLASVLMGIIRTGSYFYGLRYAPLLVAGALGLFFFFRLLLSGFLG